MGIRYSFFSSSRVARRYKFRTGTRFNTRGRSEQLQVEYMQKQFFFVLIQKQTYSPSGILSMASCIALATLEQGRQIVKINIGI